MKRKRITAAVLALCILWLQMPGALAANGQMTVKIGGQAYTAFAAQVKLNGQEVPMAVPPYVLDSRIVVPVRFLAEHVGADVKWDQAAQRVVITTLKKEIELWIGQNRMLVNGQEITLDNGSIPRIAVFENGEMRTMVPLRAIGEALGFTVGYEAASRTGTLTPAEVSDSPAAPGQPSYPGSPAGNSIEKAEVMVYNGKVVLRLSGIGQKKVKVSALEQPNRIIFDVEGAVFIPGKWEFLPISYDNINKIRVAQFQGNGDGKEAISRVVFEVSKIGNLSELQYFFEDNSLQIDIRAIEAMAEGRRQADVADKTAPDKKNNEGSVNPSPTDPTGPQLVEDWRDTLERRISQAKLLPLPGGAEISEQNKYVHILIDPGHGGRDSGTISAGQKMEKDYALAASLKLKEDLQAMGYVVYMTRETDTYPDLMTRANMANSLKVDIFISMHANSADPNRAANGIETWYSGVGKVGEYASLEKKLAAKVNKTLINATSAIDRGVKTAKHVVTANSKMTAILVEAGFLSNPVEEALLFTDNYRSVIARAVAVGVNEFVQEYRSALANSKNSMIAAEPIAPVIPSGSKRVSYRVNADALNVRKNPGLDAPSLGKVYGGEILTVEYGVEEIKKDGYTWLYTTDNSGNISGWLAKEFLIEQ